MVILKTDTFFVDIRALEGDIFILFMKICTQARVLVLNFHAMSILTEIPQNSAFVVSAKT